jgi:photosystem II stability/assembly factor-like uncharacterized protein
MIPYKSGQVQLALICLSALLTAAPLSAATLYAPIMPLAAQSLLLDVAVAGERLVAVGERGHILYSDDRGDNWAQARVPTTQMLTSVHFIDPRHGWAAGHDGLILVSDDAGEHWRIQRDGLAVQHQTNLEQREAAHRKLENLEQRLARADEQEREQLELELEDARLDLEDAELTLEEPVFTSPFMAVWFQDADRGWAAGAFGTFVATEDGGQHWVNRAPELDNPDEFHLNTITGDGTGRVFVAGEGGVMFRSLNGGRSWQTLEPFYQGSWFGAVYNPGNGDLFLFGLRGNLYRSSDFGTSWEPIENNSNSTLAGGSANSEGDVVIAGGVGTVLLSTDGGRSFRRILMEDRLGLTAGVKTGERLVLVGQGGVEIAEDAGHVR